MSVVESFAEFAQQFTLLGLFFNSIGAFALLGPELESIARFWSALDRRHVKDLLTRLEEGETLKAEKVRGFDDLKTLIQETARSPGVTGRPYEREQLAEEDLLKTFDVVEGHDEHARYRESGTGKGAAISIENLRSASDRYTGERSVYFKGGALLIAAGFYFQFVAEVASFNPPASLAVFLIGFLGITLVGRNISQ